MATPPQVSAWIKKNYPRPRVDPEWLDACYQWLINTGNHDPTLGLPALLAALERQLLESDLRDSMLHGTGLPIYITQQTAVTDLAGPPVLVEIAAIAEIGSSAFQLNQIRLAREERIRAGRGDEEGDDDGDIEVEGEGPMPKYPRGMLRFELTDGATTLQALEYRRLPELSLGTTPLGYKMQLKNVRVHRGMAFLEPKSVIMKGGRTENRETNQLGDFARGLRIRMRLPLDPDPPAIPEPQVGGPARSPLREISPPPSPVHELHVNDDENLKLRRRRVPKSAPSLSPTLAPGPSTASSSTTLVSTNSKSSTSKYFSGPVDQDIGFDFDFLDEMEKLDRSFPSSTNNIKGKGKAKEQPFEPSINDSTDSHDMAIEISSSDDYDFDDEIDAKVLEDLDRIEKDAVTIHSRTFSPNIISRPTLPLPSSRGPNDRKTIQPASQDREVIEIPDEGDLMDFDLETEDKENMPVATRHVRRRTAADQTIGRSVEVIDISDSD